MRPKGDCSSSPGVRGADLVALNEATVVVTLMFSCSSEQSLMRISNHTWNLMIKHHTLSPILEHILH
jgi:hypothetical protein